MVFSETRLSENYQAYLLISESEHREFGWCSQLKEVAETTVRASLKLQQDLGWPFCEEKNNLVHICAFVIRKLLHKNLHCFTLPQPECVSVTLVQAQIKVNLKFKLSTDINRIVFSTRAGFNFFLGFQLILRVALLMLVLRRNDEGAFLCLYSANLT